MYFSWTKGYSGPLLELNNLYKKLDGLKDALNDVRPLPIETVASLQRDLALRYTYNSNAIEGNTLTLNETKVVVEDGLTIGGKTMREHLEAINHQQAIQFVEEIAKEQRPLDARTLKDIHSLVLRGIDQDNAGRFRSVNVIISGADHTPPDALHVPEDMEKFFDWFAGDAQKLHPVERAARIHSDFVGIHPFVDGNGRTARLIMNVELIKEGYPLAIVLKEQRQEYFTNLDKAHVQGDFKPFVEQIGLLVERGFEPYSRVLGYDLEN